MRKKLTRPKLQRKFDKYFSRYIRLRDSEYGMGNCITCGKSLHYKDGHAGHFISRHCKTVRWDERNVHLQCLTAKSNIRLFNGQSKSIAKLKVGDRLWAFNENSYCLEEATVENVSKFMPKELYEVELEDGQTFYATGDHKVVANNKWVEVKEMLHDVSAYDILEL